MTPSNDNTLSADWVELCRLNDMTLAYTPADMHYIRMRGPKGVANSLWFLRFEIAYRGDVALVRRGEMRVVF